MPQPRPILTAEQQAAVRRLAASRHQAGVQTLGGYGGTGKTTVIRDLSERLPNWRVCAFTGKAANVLRRKGLHASTIHSLIYRPEEYDPPSPLDPIEPDADTARRRRPLDAPDFRLMSREEFAFFVVVHGSKWDFLSVVAPSQPSRRG